MRPLVKLALLATFLCIAALSLAGDIAGTYKVKCSMDRGQVRDEKLAALYHRLTSIYSSGKMEAVLDRDGHFVWSGLDSKKVRVTLYVGTYKRNGNTVTLTFDPDKGARGSVNTDPVELTVATNERSMKVVSGALILEFSR